METLENIPNGACNSLSVSEGGNTLVNPGSQKAGTGKSVEYAPTATSLHWFPIRATYHRAQQVFDRLVALNDGSFEPYLPTLCHVEYPDSDSSQPPQYREEPLDKGLLFVRCTLDCFSELVKKPAQVAGLTPYYNHFATNGYGRNEFLIVPDRQMESFRIIVESHNRDILVRQTEIPQLIVGDTVVVTDGPFAGVEGIVMKYKHQKRVFVQLKGIGIYATAYVPSAFLKKIEN